MVGGSTAPGSLVAGFEPAIMLNSRVKWSALSCSIYGKVICPPFEGRAFFFALVGLSVCMLVGLPKLVQ